jgi:pimeloyl-ACP methyl ester carboxylesterase
VDVDEMLVPATRYAHSGNLTIAYQSIGNGTVDLVLVPGLISHVEFLHELPNYTDCLRRLATFARVTTFDKSGQGLSDRWFGMPSFEQRVDDIGAVMDAIGSTRAALIGCSEGAPISIVFAATYPERVSHLIWFGCFARFTATADYPFRRSREEMVRRADHFAQFWGTGVSMEGFLPSYANNEDVRAQYAKLERLTFSPGALKVMYQYNMEIDVRSVLPLVQVPTLVLHRRADALVAVENGRFVARSYLKIPG